jgi:hypothetical protein
MWFIILKHGRTRFGNHETFMDGKEEEAKVAQEAAIVRRWGTYIQRDT